MPAYTTTLSLTRNAAIPAIYGGCGVMVLGLLLAFAANRKEIWFWVQSEDEGANGVGPSRTSFGPGPLFGRRLYVVGRYRYPRETLDRAAAAALRELCPQELVENDGGNRSETENSRSEANPGPNSRS